MNPSFTITMMTGEKESFVFQIEHSFRVQFCLRLKDETQLNKSLLFLMGDLCCAHHCGIPAHAVSQENCLLESQRVFEGLQMVYGKWSSHNSIVNALLYSLMSLTAAQRKSCWDNPTELLLTEYPNLLHTEYWNFREEGKKRKKKKTPKPHTFPNNSILKGYCENCIMLIEIAQFSWYLHIQSILKKAWIPHVEVQPPTLAAFKCHKIKFLAPSSLE